jgi:ubiquitin-like protein Pup
MMSQEQKNKPAPKEEQAQTPVEPKSKTADGQEIKEKAEAVEAEIDKAIDEAKTDKEAMDALVDEIDEVLEVNAEEFVKNYVQRGGE